MGQLISLLGWGCTVFPLCYFPSVLKGLGSVRGRSDLTGAAPTLALLPETSIPTSIQSSPPSSCFTRGLWSADTFKGLSGFIFKDFFPLLFFFLKLYSLKACAAGVTQHILYYPSHHFNHLILLTFTVATVGIMGSEFPLEWVSLGTVKTAEKSRVFLWKKGISWWNCLQRTGRGEGNEKSVQLQGNVSGDTSMGWQLPHSCTQHPSPVPTTGKLIQNSQPCWAGKGPCCQMLFALYIISIGFASVFAAVLFCAFRIPFFSLCLVN